MKDRHTSQPEGGTRAPHLDEHACLDLLQGYLSPAEEERILSHLAGCPACERLLQERAAEAERFEATTALRFLPHGELALERRGAALRRGRRTTTPLWASLRGIWPTLGAAFRRPRHQLAGAAVAVAALLLVMWPRPVGPPEDLHLGLLPPYTFQLLPREVPAAAGEDLNRGLEAYEAGDFKAAIEALRRARGSEPNRVYEMIRRIYLGSALAWSGQYEEAVAVLEDVPLPLVPGAWGRKTHWTLYVSLRESGRNVRADSLLHVLAGKPGEIGERARQLLEREAQD